MFHFGRGQGALLRNKGDVNVFNHAVSSLLQATVVFFCCERKHKVALIMVGAKQEVR